MTSANDFLMQGGIRSAKFPTIGTTVTGTIVREPEVQQQRDFQTGEPKFWPDGKPMQQLQVILQTSEQDGPDDNGERAIYIKGNMLKAVRDAVRKSGAPGIDVGGTLSVTYIADGEAKTRGFNPPKVYSATYTPPPAGTAANDFINGGGQEQATAAPAQPAQPAAPATSAAPAGVSPEALAALAQLTPEQKAALGIS